MVLGAADKTRLLPETKEVVEVEKEYRANVAGETTQHLLIGRVLIQSPAVASDCGD
jgi:hypothetical protein